jgi:hypothetical protein
MDLPKGKINEVGKIVGLYEVSIEGVEQRLKVKVIKYSHLDGFMGVANLEVRGKDKIGFYRSLHLQDTKEKAFEDAINGFLVFYSEEAEVREVKDW